jgi:hypothetical protein
MNTRTYTVKETGKYIVQYVNESRICISLSTMKICFCMKMFDTTKNAEPLLDTFFWYLAFYANS